ncbi:MAG: cell division protein FtsH, partial [Planctomycetaceae bacterium]|nr:cell division protein FtsH [Planctomycetaceae bacterium]
MPGMPWLLIIVVGMLVLYLMMADKSPESTGVRVDYWFFMEQLKQGETGNVKEVMFHGHVLTGKWRKTPKNPDKDGPELTEEFNTYLPDSVVLTLDLEQELNARGVERSAESADPGIGAQLLVWMIGPLLLIGFFWFMMRRQADPMGGGMMGNFVRSPAKRFFGSEQKTTFDDVAG